MIVQVGVYPNPIGGISIYIKRMKKHLDDLGINNEVWDLSNIDKNIKNVTKCRLRYVPLKLLFKKNIKLVHFNICGIKSKIYIGLFNMLFYRKRKKILTIHGDSKDLFKRDNRLLIRSLNSFDAIICVKKGDKGFLRKKGVTKPIYEISAFIFPTEDSADEVSKDILEFINKKQFVITANASSIQFYNGQDLYGIDRCIKLLSDLKDQIKNKNIGMIFCLPEVNDPIYYKKLLTLIEQYSLEDDFLFVHEKKEMYPIIKRSNLFLRPTINDGFGVSLAEAIYYNVPAIATDVCKRPEGTEIIQSCNGTDLLNKTIDIINNYDKYKEKLKDVKLVNNGDTLLHVYENFIHIKN